MIRSLEDTHRRKVTYLRVSITDRCNLRCTYCVPAEGVEWREREEILRYDEILRIVGVGAKCGFRKIRVTGGEPLVRKGAVDLIAALGHIEGIEEVAISTNGVLFKSHARALFDAGLRKVNFSLDSLNPGKFAEVTRRNSFYEVWAGIQEAEQIGFSPIKINVVAQQGVNDNEVIELSRMTIGKPFHVRFIELMPCASRELWRKEYYPMADMRMRIESGLGKLLPEPISNGTSGPALNFRLVGGKGTIGFIPAISDQGFCDRCNRIRLSADGKLYPCLFGEGSVDLRELLRRGCNDEEIESLFEEALRIKPATHELEGGANGKMRFTMVTIGG